MHILFFLSFIVLALSGTSPCSLLVAPHGFADVRTLRAAQLAVRSRLSSGILLEDFVVCVSGRHDVSLSPLSFTDADATLVGGGRVVWRGAKGGGAVVSGGVQVTGWVPSTLGGGPAFVAPVPTGFAVDAVVRQLWAGDVRATRTRLDNVESALGGLSYWEDTENGTIGFTAGTAALPQAWSLNSSSAIEFVWPLVINNWISPRCAVAAISGRNVTLASPCGALLLKRSGVSLQALPPPVFVEAVPLFPLQPGTFYHDRERARLFYAPRSPAELENAWVAPAEVLVTYSGVTGHVWQDLTFELATWEQPNTSDGFVDKQSAVFFCTPGAGCGGVNGTGEPPAAVRVTNSTNVAFQGCNFTRIGAPYALSVAGGSQRVNVSGCVFTDLSGGFLKLGSVDPAAANGPPSGWDARLSVVDNTVTDVALEFEGAAALFGGFIFGCDVSHNTICNAAYTGVSLGWGWGDVIVAGYGGNSISYNRMSRVMTQLRDGGGIYVNGATNAAFPSLVQGNYLFDQGVALGGRKPHDSNFLYLDNGASSWLVTDNVLCNSPRAWAYHMTGGGTVPEHARNNQLNNLWYQNTQAGENDCGPWNCSVDAATVFLVNGAWPPQAQAIVDGAGVRTDTQHTH